ncbi:hypothetical protein ACMHYK_07945 [Candidatus Enterenecus avicola]
MFYTKETDHGLFANLVKMSKAKYTKLVKDVNDADLSDGFRTVTLDIE